jgi:2'-hydroxyisoflavone reductase
MRILILGGTVFLGRHVVEAAQARGHELTLFNRGQTNPDLFADVEKLRGDRDGDLTALTGRSFDAVVDTSGYVPRVVRETIEALGGVGHYTFVSTIGVYADFSQPPGEDAPVATLEKETEDWRQAYGALKALCEEEVRRRFPDAFVVRPGLISGPWDPTARFTYWPVRVAEGGRILAPEPPLAPAQIIDVRDLAEWIVEAAERSLAGTYNAVSEPFTLEYLLGTCRQVTGSDADVVWVDPDFLAEHDVSPWMDLPLWLNEPGQEGFLRVPSTPAIRNGLRIRPLAETVADTLEWARTGRLSDPPAGLERDRAGLDREKERRILDAWTSKE